MVEQSVHRQRARAALTALDRHFAVRDGSDLVREFTPYKTGDHKYSYEWPFSQVRSATDDLALSMPQDFRLRSLASSRDRGQERYWHKPGGTTGLPGYASATNLREGAHGTYFYDDNSWVGLAETQRYLASGRRRGNLSRVREIVALLRSAQSYDPSLPSPGGLFWSQGDDGDRNTVATMPAAKLALRMHQLTGERSFFVDAMDWVEWTRETLLSPQGLFWDHIKLSGEIEKTFWAYNQGVPLGVETLLYEICQDPVHRTRAIEILEAIIDFYDPLTEGGKMDEQPVFFVAIMCSNLLMAQSVIGDEINGWEITDALADRAWRLQRDPKTDLHNRLTGNGRLEVLAQAGFARLMALAAVPRRTWRSLC